MFDIDDFTTGSVCHLHEFPSRIELGDTYMRIAPDRQIGGFSGWWFGLVRKTDDNGTYYVPTFQFPRLLFYPYVSVRVLMEPVNHLGRSNEEFKYTDKFIYKTEDLIFGRTMYLSEILDTKNGWLSEDGTFTIHLGFCIDALKDTDGCWRFNFLDIPFKQKLGPTIVKLISEGEPSEWLTSHVQMFKLHYPRLPELTKGTLKEETKLLGCPCWCDARACLNILHGVQLRFMSYEEFFGILEIAKLFGFQNVIRYCERHLIEDGRPIGDIEDRVLRAIQADFNRYFINFIERIETGK